MQDLVLLVVVLISSLMLFRKHLRRQEDAEGSAGAVYIKYLADGGDAKYQTAKMLDNKVELEEQQKLSSFIKMVLLIVAALVASIIISSYLVTKIIFVLAICFFGFALAGAVFFKFALWASRSW